MITGVRVMVSTLKELKLFNYSCSTSGSGTGVALIGAFKSKHAFVTACVEIIDNDRGTIGFASGGYNWVKERTSEAGNNFYKLMAFTNPEKIVVIPNEVTSQELWEDILKGKFFYGVDIKSQEEMKKIIAENERLRTFFDGLSEVFNRWEERRKKLDE